MLPPLEGLRLHVHRVLHAGRPADVGVEKATAFSVSFMSQWQGTLRSQPRNALNLGRQDRAEKALFGQGEEVSHGFRAIRVFEVVSGVVSSWGHGTERGKCRVVVVLHVLHEVIDLVEVEWQLDLSSMAARLRGVLVLLVRVKESRRIHVPPLVPVSTIVESGPRHKQSNVLTCWALVVCPGLLCHG
ncbi:hypothetical protein Taro_021927 [Colocasia esculenta]|uniref:Uncharacterized protein n=1 Tax=Colocasia esculenta TaxID=4460 RepID=A0A843V6V1_COLES|nr:hypothetical protein [Colocasia esculenta]